MNSRMWVDVSIFGIEMHFEVGKTFKPSNDSAIVCSFHFGKKEKNKFLIYKVPNGRV